MVSPLGNFIGPGSGTVEGSSDGSSSNGFQVGNGDRKLDGSLLVVSPLGPGSGNVGVMVAA